MVNAIGNLRSRVPLRAAWVLGSTVLSALFLAGAVSLPARALERARGDHARAAGRAAEARGQRELLSRYEEALALGRVERAERAIDELLPRDLSGIELRGTLQLLARAAGLELFVLSVSDPAAVDLEVLDDQVALREVALSGRGAMSSLADLVESLRGLGYPTAVLQFDLARSETGAAAFEIRATLGLFESIPAPPESAYPEALQGADA